MKKFNFTVIKFFSLAVALTFVTVNPALAQFSDLGFNLSDISGNAVGSLNQLPFFISAMAYLGGMLLAVSGVLKTKAHVENPQQVQLHEPVIRYLAGGALFALPIVYDAMKNSIGGGSFDGGDGSLLSLISGGIGFLSSWVPVQSFNQILGNILGSISEVPFLLSALAYLIGMVMGVSAVYKMKEHVENPQQVTLKEPVIRLAVGGGLFALPAIFNAMTSLVGSTGIVDLITDGLGMLSAFANGSACDASTISALVPGLGELEGVISDAASGTLAGDALDFVGYGDGDENGFGQVMCNLTAQTGALPAFFNAVAYLFGIILGIWALLKVKDHVLNPQQTSIWEAVSRFVAGGAFFALPATIKAIQNTVNFGITPFIANSFNNEGVTGEGLDAKLVLFMNDIYGPAIFLMNWFGYIAGTILVMIGISRLMKSAQEGARGPGGIGTIMTFLTAGALLSLLPLVRAISASLFGTSLNPFNTVASFATLSYFETEGADAAAAGHVHAVISAVLQFMIILGFVSILRGVFIMRAVAEGNGQASMMAGITHLVGGALAANLGALLNAIQATLGLTEFGVNFGGNGTADTLDSLGDLVPF